MLPGPVTPREPLGGDLDADVAIVGAGMTGLWTAYYLLCRDPRMRVVLLEREVAGYGASGRNGGWCSALFAVPPSRLARLHGLPAMHAMRRAMAGTVDEVGRVAATEGIDCGFDKGGSITLARSPAQLSRATAEIEEARELGIGEDDLSALGPAEATSRCNATGVLGATFTPHCAAVDPARLCRGLADVVERLGGRVYEHTAATSIEPAGRDGGPAVRTAQGRVTAEVVVRATEAYSVELPGSHRALAPVYSLMVATEPLAAEVWSEIGLRHREAFSDHRNLIIYGQRTSDGRIAFGGRGAPYHYGSKIATGADRDAKVHSMLRASLRELFPVLSRCSFTHAWGGPIGVPRDWFSSVGLDRGTGLAWAGGYVGDGVSTTNLAGRTLAELIGHDSSELTRLPWVGHRSRSWEPEPLRYLGINAGLRSMAAADGMEARTGRVSRVGGAVRRALFE
ncbi:MAG: NAD(P)/FAD-dependent oxidoreductase [Acidimicrobiales bacterium]